MSPCEECGRAMHGRKRRFCDALCGRRNLNRRARQGLKGTSWVRLVAKEERGAGPEGESI